MTDIHEEGDELFTMIVPNATDQFSGHIFNDLFFSIVNSDLDIFNINSVTGEYYCFFFFFVCFDHLFYKPLLQFTLIAQRHLSGVYSLFTVLNHSFILSTHLNSTAAYVLSI